MRILITQRKLVQWGGSEMFTIELVKALRQRGHEVVVFCPQPGDSQKSSIHAEGRSKVVLLTFLGNLTSFTANTIYRPSPP